MSLGPPPILFQQAWRSSSSDPSDHQPSLSGMYFAPRPTSPPVPVPKAFRVVQSDHAPHPKSAWPSDTRSNGDARTRTSSIVSVTRHTGKGKEKETTDSIASSTFTDPWPAVERVKSTSSRLGSTHSSSRPNSADPSTPRRHGSLLGAASDALRFGRRRKSLKQPPPIRQEVLTEVIEISAPKPDEEEEERQRLRDAAARSVGLGIDLLEPARSRDDSLYEEEEDEEHIQHAPSRDDIRSMDSSNTDALSPNRSMRESAPVILSAHPFANSNRRRAGSLVLSLNKTPSRATSQSPSPTVPAFPATHSSLTPFVHLSATLPKYYPPPSLFMMALSKQWRTRFIVLTTPVQGTRSKRASLGPTVSYLHLFKSSGNDEREIERLEINENSVVFVTDEEIGSRRNVVKVGGVDVGAMKKELNAEETGLTMMMLQIVDHGESRKWINAIKSNILGQRSIRAGLGLPSNNLGGVEPRGDMDVMLSMRKQGMVSPSLPSSPLSPDFATQAAQNHILESLDLTSKSPTSTVRSQNSPQRSPKAVTALKGLFTGSGRSRSSSRATSPEPDDDFPGDSFGSVASSMMAMPKPNGTAMSIGERARSPQSSSPIIKSLALLSPTTSPVSLQETHLERRIVDNQTNMDWAISGPPSPTIVTPTRAMSPSSLMPPPPRRRAWTTNEAPPVKRESPGLLIYNHGNASTAGSFGVALSADFQSNGSSGRPSTEFSGSGSNGTPMQKGRGSSVSSVSTLASGDRENMGLDRSNSNNRRWSRQPPMSKRSSPSSVSPPPGTWQSGSVYSPRLSHPYAAERLSSDRPSSRASSSNQSHKSPPSLGSNLQKFSKRASASSSIYSVSTTNSSPPPKSNRLSVPRPGSNKRLSLPPPQRPAPVMALPPTPPGPSDSCSSAKRPGSAPATKTSFRDSFAQRAKRLSMLPPTNPPSHSLPPRPDELDTRSHNRASSIDSKPPSESLYTIPSTPTDTPYPLPSGPPPTSTPSSPRLSAAFKQRLRILSAPSAPPPLHTPPAAPPPLFDLEIAAAQASTPSTPIGERITNMQNDPNFLLLATPITPTQPIDIPVPPQLPPRSPFRPPPPERSPQDHEMTSLSPPPRRGSRQIATPEREKSTSEVEAGMSASLVSALRVPEDASVELGERRPEPEVQVEMEMEMEMDLSRNASTLSLGVMGVS
ncbi:hypothetical protein DENSPDRAFT_928377 [Dentipellis sp. KUC8613]|nr:hypothetical protein DENSPDRAFT_928377 [Dentipellis sp. KUC8613]